MKTVLFLNKFDSSFVPIALQMKSSNEEVTAVLCQDAIFLAIKNAAAFSDVTEAVKRGVLS